MQLQGHQTQIQKSLVSVNKILTIGLSWGADN